MDRNSGHGHHMTADTFRISTVPETALAAP